MRRSGGLSGLVLIGALASCGGVPASSASTRNAPRPLADDRAPETEALSGPGSLRRSLEPYRTIWVVAGVTEGYDIHRITKTERVEPVRYHPVVGKDFTRTERREVPAAPRTVDCVLGDLPGVSFHGTVFEVREHGSGRLAGQVFVEVDNTERLILPGKEVALAVHTDRDPVILTGVAELPTGSRRYPSL